MINDYLQIVAVYGFAFYLLLEFWRGFEEKTSQPWTLFSKVVVAFFLCVIATGMWVKLRSDFSVLSDPGSDNMLPMSVCFLSLALTWGANRLYGKLSDPLKSEYIDEPSPRADSGDPTFRGIPKNLRD